VIERAARPAAACAAIALPAHREPRGPVIRQPGHDLLEQRRQALAFRVAQRRQQLGQHASATLQERGVHTVAVRREMQRVRPPVASRAPLDETAIDEALHDLHGRRLRDPQHAVERLGRLAWIRREVDEHARGGPAAAECVRNRRGRAIGAGEHGDAKQVF
jgi:hypothetical protein